MLTVTVLFLLVYFAMNWSKLLVDLTARTPASPTTIPTALPLMGVRPNLAVIEMVRPRINGERPQLRGFVNDKRSMIDTIGRADFSICSDGLGDQNASVRFNWTITLSGIRTEILTDRCRLRWRAPREGVYHVRVSAFHSSRPHHAMVVGDRLVVIRDIWIAAIGDSFASGEGNPDTPVEKHGIIPARWLSERCHRSSRSWAYKTYENIARKFPDYGILFTYIPCTGAAISRGILERSNGGLNGQSQINRVSELKKLTGRPPDLLLVSAGGNDLGYAEIIYSMLWGESKTMFDTLDMRFFFLSHQLDRLAKAIADKLGVQPGATIFSHYFDLTRNELGEIDANCSELINATTEQFVFAEKHILKRINKIISTKGTQQKWTVVDDVGKIFERHGFCSNESFILSLRDSFNIQGNNNGAFHPIEEAHRRISESVWSKIKHLFRP